MMTTLSSVGLAESKDASAQAAGSMDYLSPVPRDPFVPYGPPLLALRPSPRQDDASS